MASREVVSRRGCDCIGLALKAVTVIELEGVDHDVVIDLLVGGDRLVVLPVAGVGPGVKAVL